MRRRCGHVCMRLEGWVASSRFRREKRGHGDEYNYGYGEA